MKQKIIDSTVLLKQMRDEYVTLLKRDDEDDSDTILPMSKQKEEDALESRREEILELIETLKTEFPQFKEVLSRVGGMANQALPI